MRGGLKENAVADNSIFNKAALLEATCDDAELAAQVVGVFLTDIPAQLADLAKALDGNDAKTAERVSHSIKGASATVGAGKLRDVAFICENLGREGDLEQLRGKVGELRGAYDELATILQAEGFAAL